MEKNLRKRNLYLHRSSWVQRHDKPEKKLKRAERTHIIATLIQGRLNQNSGEKRKRSWLQFLQFKVWFSCSWRLRFLLWATVTIIPIIFGATAGGLFLIFICITCFFFQCQERQFRRYWSAGRFTATTMTYTGAGVSQLNPHYPPHQVPPAFQQTCPYHPSPPPEQHQTFTPPPPYEPWSNRSKWAKNKLEAAYTLLACVWSRTSKAFWKRCEVLIFLKLAQANLYNMLSLY